MPNVVFIYASNLVNLAIDSLYKLSQCPSNLDSECCSVFYWSMTMVIIIIRGGWGQSPSYLLCWDRTWIIKIISQANKAGTIIIIKITRSDSPKNVNTALWMHFWPWYTCMYFYSSPVWSIFVKITFLFNETEYLFTGKRTFNGRSSCCMLTSFHSHFYIS